VWDITTQLTADCLAAAENLYRFMQRHTDDREFPRRWVQLSRLTARCNVEGLRRGTRSCQHFCKQIACDRANEVYGNGVSDPNVTDQASTRRGAYAQWQYILLTR